MRAWKLLVAVLTVGIAVGLWPNEAAAFDGTELREDTRRQIRNAARLAENRPNDRKTERALEILERILADETRPSLDRSVAFEMRGRLRFRLDGDVSKLADDLIRALNERIGWFSRGDKLVDQAWRALIQAGRADEVDDFLIAHGDKMFGRENAAGLLRAELLAADGRLQEALDVIGPVNNPEDDLLERRLRFALLITLNRFAEARACIETFVKDAFYSATLQEELEFLVGFEAANPSRAERRAHGMEFTTRLDELFEQAEPIERVAPRSFERCIDSFHRATERVRLVFDVNADGSTSNIEVTETTDPCYNRSSVRAVTQWRYEPAVFEGEVVPRESVSTIIVFVLN